MLDLTDNQPAAGAPSSFTNWLAYGAAVVCGFVAAASITRFFSAHLGHDQAWGLYLGERVLSGVALNGPHLTEVNPPFIVWFMAVPVMIGNLVHVSAIVAFRYFFMILAAIHLYWAVQLFQRIYRPPSFVLWTFSAFGCACAALIIEGDSIGQREHIVAFLFLPYLFAATARLERKRLGRNESIVVGVVAAMAICLKPQHGLDFLLVEIVVLLGVRSLRRWAQPVPFAIIAILLLYALSVRLFAPTYLTQIVPLLQKTYWGFNTAYRVVVRDGSTSIALLLAGCLSYVVLRRQLQYRTLIRILIAAAAGSSLVYLQQHKGWSYQRVTFDIFAYFVVLLSGLDLGQRWLGPSHNSRTSGLRCAFLAVVAFVLGLPPGLRSFRGMDYAEPEKRILADILKPYPPGTAVTYLSKNPWEFPLLVEQSKVLGTRYYHLWLLPAIIRSQDPSDLDKHHLAAADAAQLSMLLRSTEAEDLSYFKPSVVVVDSCTLPQFCNPAENGRFDTLIDWFLADPAFRAQWSSYQYARTVGGLEVYTRKP